MIKSFTSKEAKNLWKSVTDTYELEEFQRETLHLACECLDRLDDARKALKADGQYFKDKFGQIKPHPAHSIENQNRSAFKLLLRELNLDVEPADTRPKRR